MIISWRLLQVGVCHLGEKKNINDIRIRFFKYIINIILYI